MSDATLLRLIDCISECPSLVEGNRQYVAFEGLVLELHRVGKHERWAFGPTSDAHPIDAPWPAWWTRTVRTWVSRVTTLNFVTHGHAMAAHTL